MRAEISRVYITDILNNLDEYETEYDKIKTAQFICKFVFATDILFDQYGNHDKEFNDFFGQKVQELYVKYPEQFKKYMDEYEQFLEDMGSDYGNSTDSYESSGSGDEKIEYC